MPHDLHIVQFWDSLLVPIYCKKQFFLIMGTDPCQIYNTCLICYTYSLGLCIYFYSLKRVISLGAWDLFSLLLSLCRNISSWYGAKLLHWCLFSAALPSTSNPHFWLAVMSQSLRGRDDVTKLESPRGKSEYGDSFSTFLLALLSWVLGKLFSSFLFFPLHHGSINTQ